MSLRKNWTSEWKDLVRASEGSRTVISFSRSLPRSWKSRIAFSLQWCLIFSRMTHLWVLSELWYLMWNPKVLGLFLSQACEKNKFINNNNYEFEIVRSFASLQRAIVVAVLQITISPSPFNTRYTYLLSTSLVRMSP